MLMLIDSFTKHKKAVKYIAEHLSPLQIQEIELLEPDTSPEKALKACANISDIGFLCFDREGTPRGMGGVTSDHNIWFVVTDGIEKSEIIPWLKGARTVTAALMNKHKKLWGYCWDKNQLARIWMRWCGFEFAVPDSPANRVHNGEHFTYFQKT